MLAKRLTPILNVSNIKESFEWFEKLGWKKAWDWGDPPDFGGVCSGECEIFLCENGQGGRGKSASIAVTIVARRLAQIVWHVLHEARDYEARNWQISSDRSAVILAGRS